QKQAAHQANWTSGNGRWFSRFNWRRGLGTNRQLNVDLAWSSSGLYDWLGEPHRIFRLCRERVYIFIVSPYTHVLASDPGLDHWRCAGCTPWCHPAEETSFERIVCDGGSDRD